MSWSLKISNGDLALGGASYDTVTGHAKLVQDLRAQLLERMGTDPAHPEFGSLLDGGRLRDGTEIPSPLGSIDWNKVILDIEIELRRIERDYTNKQQVRLDADKHTYRNITLIPEEVLSEISNVSFQQVQDTLFVQITLSTASGRQDTLVIPVGTAPVV